jgi:hypothetical protein
MRRKRRRRRRRRRRKRRKRKKRNTHRCPSPETHKHAALLHRRKLLYVVHARQSEVCA